MGRQCEPDASLKNDDKNKLHNSIQEYIRLEKEELTSPLKRYNGSKEYLYHDLVDACESMFIVPILKVSQHKIKKYKVSAVQNLLSSGIFVGASTAMLPFLSNGQASVPLLLATSVTSLCLGTYHLVKSVVNAVKGYRTFRQSQDYVANWHANKHDPKFVESWLQQNNKMPVLDPFLELTDEPVVGMNSYRPQFWMNGEEMPVFQMDKYLDNAAQLDMDYIIQKKNKEALELHKTFKQEQQNERI